MGAKRARISEAKIREIVRYVAADLTALQAAARTDTVNRPTGACGSAVLGDTASVLIHNPEVELSGGEALLSRQPIPANSLCIVLRNIRAIFVIFPEDQLIKRIPVGSEFKPAPGLDTVLRHALAVRICDPKTTLSGRVSLVGRESVPTDCLVKVLGNTLAYRVQEPELGLRGGISLVGREAIPLDCLAGVAQPNVKTEVVLRFRVALLSQLAQLVDCQFGGRLLRVEARTGTERTDAHDNGGQGEDACVVNRHARPSRSHDDDGTTVGNRVAGLNVDPGYQKVHTIVKQS